MGKKRKSNVVVKLSEEKRRALTWNLLEDAGFNDPFTGPGTSRQPPQECPKQDTPEDQDVLVDVESDEPIPPFHISRSLCRELYEKCEYSVSVHHEGFSCGRDDLVGTLCYFKLCLRKIEPGGSELPDLLPRQPASFMIRHGCLPCHLVFDDEEGGKRVIGKPCLCMEVSFDQSIPLDSIEYLCRINKGRRLRLEVKGYHPRELFVTVGIDLLKGSVSLLRGPSDYPACSNKVKKDRKHMQQLMAYCFGFPCTAALNRSMLTNLNFHDVFQQIYRNHQEEELDTRDRHIQHSKLIPTLRPYQVNAIRWMVQKETFTSLEKGDELHELWRKVTTQDGRTLYYNPFSAEISLTPFSSLPSSPGGILADEMGLGKTVEMLACILNNPRPKDQLPQMDFDDEETVIADDEEYQSDGSLSSPVDCNVEQVSEENMDIDDSTGREGTTSQDMSMLLESIHNGANKSPSPESQTFLTCMGVDGKTTNKSQSSCSQSSPTSMEIDCQMIHGSTEFDETALKPHENQPSLSPEPADEVGDTLDTSAASRNDIKGNKLFEIAELDKLINTRTASSKDNSTSSTQLFSDGKNELVSSASATFDSFPACKNFGKSEMAPSENECFSPAALLRDSEGIKEEVCEDGGFSSSTSSRVASPQNKYSSPVADNFRDSGIEIDSPTSLPEISDKSDHTSCHDLVKGSSCKRKEVLSPVLFSYERTDAAEAVLGTDPKDQSGKDPVQETVRETVKREYFLHNGMELGNRLLHKADAKQSNNQSQESCSIGQCILDSGAKESCKSKEDNVSFSLHGPEAIQGSQESLVAKGVETEGEHHAGMSKDIRQQLQTDGSCLQSGMCNNEVLNKDASAEQNDRVSGEKVSLSCSKAEAPVGPPHESGLVAHKNSVSGINSGIPQESFKIGKAEFATDFEADPPGVEGEDDCLPHDERDSPNECVGGKDDLAIGEGSRPNDKGDQSGMSEGAIEAESQMTDEDENKPSGEASGEEKEKSTMVKPNHPAVSTIPSDKRPSMVKLSCLCGGQTEVVSSCIQCKECSSWQHAECVNWETMEIHSGPCLAENNRYLCPHCRIGQPPVKSGATLIVSPSSISQQWVDEINRHVRSHSLNILVYRGVKFHKFLQPLFLARHDIVITTYNVLKTELNYVKVPHSSSQTEGRRLRHAKRYMAVPSPLPAVEWWRVCLDEAQMVECPTAKSAEMALHLSAVNRWCVTGTPIQTGLDDLYGLFLFLNEDPHRTKFWWDTALCSPFTQGDREPMLKFLSKKLWRTAKDDVLDQIKIPSQEEEVHWLTFSPVEAHYYKKKHESCSYDFSRALDRTKVDLAMKLSDMDRHTLSRLVHPLLSLRQACCHPQAVRGEFIRIDQRTMKMEDLLQSLISKGKLECEDAQRQLVCAINGQAAMHLMSGEVLEAVDKYREVLRSADEQKGQLNTDSLQIYHAMFNLNMVLEAKHEGVAPTTRDGQLKEQMQELRDKYMSRALTNVTACGETLFPISEKIKDLQAMFPKSKPGWWLDAIIYLEEQGLGEKVIDKMKDDTQRLNDRFYDYRGLQFVIQDEVDGLMRCFKEAKAGVQKLSGPVTPQLVSQTVDCHLRPFRGIPKNDCLFCKVERALQDYEMQLFSFEPMSFLDALMTRDDMPSTSAGGKVHTIRPRGTWAMSELQKMLKNLQTFLKTYCGDPDLLEDAAKYLEMMELMKKEFKPLRAYWGALLERVAAIDELDMAKMRLRVKLPDEPYDPASQPYIILHAEIPVQKTKLLNDRAVASSELRRKMGQLVYLQNLEKAQYSLEGVNPEPCPICTRELGAQWAVFPCGHCYCCDCMTVLNSRNHAKNMKCPVCRQTVQRREVSFVSMGMKESDAMAESIKVVGGYSSKVEAVVRTLIHIQRKSPGAKSLVFSAWSDVLNIISKALQDNQVSFHHITQTSHKKFADKIQDFKGNSEVSTLLLPLKVACNGLNIIEATHVLLVEPILNPATELQAIGRVHRIGQTRHTVIHRFFVRSTIEEELHKYLKTNPLSNDDVNDKSETGNLTVDQLRGLLSFHTGQELMET